jgi:hypothetical protein
MASRWRSSITIITTIITITWCRVCCAGYCMVTTTTTIIIITTTIRDLESRNAAAHPSCAAFYFSRWRAFAARNRWR